MVGEDRRALFISHANPEDNAFTIWLGAKLAALGYEVWADVLRLRGGQDWQRLLEDALRNRACKMFLVANSLSVAKQGVRNEIQIAHTVGREIGDNQFIIPLRLSRFDAPFLIAHAQYFDFEGSWARGLAELLVTLDETYGVPRNQGEGPGPWLDIQLLHSKRIAHTPEPLISNWLELKKLPRFLRCYEFRGAVSQERAKERIGSAPWPSVVFGNGFLSFAPIHDLQEHFGRSLPLNLVGDRQTRIFLERGWPQKGIKPWDARNKFSDLGRQAFERLFDSKRLSKYELANRQTAWWASIDAAPQSKISFRWGSLAGQRQIQGISIKRNMHWHFGVSIAVRSGPIPHVRMLGRLIFTEDGRKPFDDAMRMNRLRRSFAKAWRNPRWRDMLMAFLSWTAAGKSELVAATDSADGFLMQLPPITWTAPISIPVIAETEELDEDDPSDEEEFEDFDGDQEEAGEDEQDRPS